MSDRRLRITSAGLGTNTDIAIVEPDGTAQRVPKLTRATFAVAWDGAATATLEAIEVDLSGEGVLVGDVRHRMTEYDVMQLVLAYQRAVSNLLQAATMNPECAQQFARDLYNEHIGELRRWLVDMSPLPQDCMVGPGGGQ